MTSDPIRKLQFTVLAREGNDRKFTLHLRMSDLPEKLKRMRQTIMGSELLSRRFYGVTAKFID